MRILSPKPKFPHRNCLSDLPQPELRVSLSILPLYTSTFILFVRGSMQPSKREGLIGAHNDLAQSQSEFHFQQKEAIQGRKQDTHVREMKTGLNILPCSCVLSSEHR